jgi:hypothetical protein
VAKKKPKQINTMNKPTVKKHIFVEYEVGDRFFLSYTPSKYFQDYTEKNRKIKSPLSPKIMIRYVGPYTITKKFSAVLYECLVNGEVQTVHAVNMKPDPHSKYYNIHRLHLPPNEPPKDIEFKPRLLPSGKPEIPMRILTKLKSTVQPTITRKKKIDKKELNTKLNEIDDLYEEFAEQYDENEDNNEEIETYLPYFEYPEDDYEEYLYENENITATTK